MVQSTNNQWRPLGQRCIASSFIFRPINQSKDLREAEPKKDPNEGSRVSLSDFLDQKLKRNSQLPRTVKGKLQPFASPLGARDKGVFVDCQVVEDKEEKQENNSLNQVIFEQFRHSGTRKDGTCPYGSCENETLSSSFGLSPEHLRVDTSNLREGASRQQNPFDGHRERRTVPKHQLVSDDCRPKRDEREESFIHSCKRPRRRYNHYANGGGWWDCNREGVDAEEVGLGEIWEGVGSTTFGDWH